MTDIIMMSPDLAARKIIVAAFLYYVLDNPTMTDGEYDKLSLYVSQNWKKLHPDRQWALGDADSTRATGSHFKFSCLAVHAAYAKLKTKPDIRIDWKEDEVHGRYTTA